MSDYKENVYVYLIILVASSIAKLFLLWYKKYDMIGLLSVLDVLFLMSCMTQFWLLNIEDEAKK